MRHHHNHGHDGHHLHGFVRHMARHFGRHRGESWGEESGHGRGRRRVFDAAELRLVLLKLLQDQPRHGYDLIRAVEELSAGAYSPSPGVVYPTLTLLAEMGHTSEDLTDTSRKTYAVTAEGIAFLDARKAEVEALMARLAEMGQQRERVDATSIRRAMGNLRTVLMNRLGGEDASPETLHAVTAILDDAAQRIERL
ncbi:MAG: PadR family transcriptional regulator [Alphaproteobacteria bacterium]|nr:PadR family transcriptional regulator [Alphaproteobacteria bacterium]MDB5740792.1 PadR family transcriptional regulator [Alphaproteobacteria bacterium]